MDNGPCANRSYLNIFQYVGSQLALQATTLNIHIFLVKILIETLATLVLFTLFVTPSNRLHITLGVGDLFEHWSMHNIQLTP